MGRTTFTEEQILDMAMEDMKNLEKETFVTINRENLAHHLHLDELVELFNNDEDGATYSLTAEVDEILRRHGEAIRRYEAEVEVDGEQYLMTWVPENVSWVHANPQWEFAFNDVNNPPRIGEIYVATGNMQHVTQMVQVDSLGELCEGYCHLESLVDKE